MKLLIKIVFSVLFTLSLYGKEPHLILYFDINSTLIASDQKQDRSAENTLNKIFASQSKAHWDATLQEPITYTDYVKKVLIPGSHHDPELDKKRDTYYYNFIEGLRESGHPLYQEIAEAYHHALTKLPNSPNRVFSSFYLLLDKLEEEQRSYTIILRSFGSEVFNIAKEINASFVPLFDHYGKFKHGTLLLDEQQEGSNLSEVYEMLHSHSHIAIRDDYDHWEKGEFRTPFGKPFLLDLSNEDVLEIFFDDHINLHSGETNIIAPIDIKTGQLIPLEQLAQSGQIVRVNTLEAILEEDYFIKHVEKALQFRGQQEPYDVGELGASWEFPSDHLPVGVSINDLHFACWNILNKEWLEYIEMNTQGLKHSSILRDNIPCSEGSSLTIRERFIGESILHMVQHPTHPRSLIALQETNRDVIDFLQSQLPSSWRILISELEPEDIFLYDSNVFEPMNTKVVNYTLPVSNIIFTVDLREKNTGKGYRVIQSHIPGGPKSPAACTEFAHEVLQQHDENLAIILMGDMNQPPSYINAALQRAAIHLNVPQPYSALSIASPTHVNTYLEASWIDNLFIASKEGKDEVEISSGADELFPALEPIIKLFKEKRISKP